MKNWNNTQMEGKEYISQQKYRKDVAKNKNMHAPRQNEIFVVIPSETGRNFYINLGSKTFSSLCTLLRPRRKISFYCTPSTVTVHGKAPMNSKEFVMLRKWTAGARVSQTSSPIFRLWSLLACLTSQHLQTTFPV